MTPKPWYKSRTLLFNAVSLAVLVADTLTGSHLITDPRMVTAFGAVVTLGNGILRIFATSQPIGAPPPAD